MNTLGFINPVLWGNLGNGTYFKVDSHTLFNYGNRWNYGYIVATDAIMEIPFTPNRAGYQLRAVNSIPDRTLFGIWTDPDIHSRITYVDLVSHIDVSIDAFELARTYKQKCVYNLRTNSTVDIDY
jgi:hypothetical protein